MARHGGLPMVNKRNQPRRNTPHRINVLAADDDRVLGRLVNITSGGLMFLSAEAFSRSQVISLRVPLPTMTQNRSSIELRAQVVWQGSDANPNYTRVGVQFENVGAEEGFIIETVLQRLHLVG